MAPLITGPRVLVQAGLDSSLLLLEDWHCSCTFSSPLGIPLGQPDVMEIFAEGLLAGVKAVNKSVHSVTLALLLFQIFAPKCLFCVTCGFLVPLQFLCRLPADRCAVLQSSCGSWPVRAESILERLLKSDVPFGQSRLAWVNKGQIFSFFFGIYIVLYIGKLPLPQEHFETDSHVTDLSCSN